MVRVANSGKQPPTGSKKFDRASFIPRQAKKGRPSEWPVDVLKCRQRGVEGGARIWSHSSFDLCLITDSQ